MKYFMFLMLMVVSVSSYADGICHIPIGCNMFSSEFSSGGGDKSIYIMEVDCRFDNGKVIKYIDKETSLGGFVGFGRITMPSKVVFVEDTKDSIECDY